MRAQYEVGHLLREYRKYILKGPFNAWQRRTLLALSRCRTAEMGGHIDVCSNHQCRHIHLSYNSCRNRHCPKCQGHKREEWIQKREEELLPITYFHVVFTLPSELHQIALHQPRFLYNTLFKSAWKVVKGFAKNPKFLGAQSGMISILHTWGSAMTLHPHLHCIVPSGGLTKNGKWKKGKRSSSFLFPVKAMSKVFRATFVKEMRKKGIKDQVLFDQLFKKSWVVYAKKPFYSPKTVVEYLGRYTHKIAISNHRLKMVTDTHTTFEVKNYRKGGVKERLKLTNQTFIRRFALHILPKGFVRIRHFGFLSSVGKKRHLDALRKQLKVRKKKPKKLKTQHLQCPICKKGKLKTVGFFTGKDPPRYWQERLKRQTSRR